MSHLITRERFGSAQLIAGILLLLFAAQCVWFCARVPARAAEQVTTGADSGKTLGKMVRQRESAARRAYHSALMDATLAKVRRRPFLAPIWIIAATVFVALLVAAAIWSHALVTTIVVARPAEREIGTKDGAPLSAAGEARAERLAQLFGARRGPGMLSAIYQMSPERTQRTVAPLEARVGLAGIIAEEHPAAVASRVLKEQAGKAVLIIAAAPDVAVLVDSLSGDASTPAVAEADYDVLYVVSVPAFGRASVLRLSY